MNSVAKQWKPAISVVILTYKRQDELLRTLRSVYVQTSIEMEVLVVNNNPDDTGLVLASEFPEVRYIDTGGNIGCEARNIGVAAARADIVVTLDNDVNMGGEDFAEKIIDFFERHKTAGCVNFKVLKPDGSLSLRDWCHPRDYQFWSGNEFLTDHISEGASAFKKDAFEIVGGYYSPFFIGHEGPDLCLRLIKSGYETWFTPTVEVVHYASTDERPSWRPHYYNTRNNIWLAYRHYPLLKLVQYCLLYTSMSLFYAIRNKNFSAFLTGFYHGVCQSTKHSREPLSKFQIKKLKNIYFYKPSFINKVIKHLFSDQSYR
jgi:GT2 family glycosyltransferase